MEFAASGIRLTLGMWEVLERRVTSKVKGAIRSGVPEADMTGKGAKVMIMK